MDHPKLQDLVDTPQPPEAGPHDQDGLSGIVRTHLIPAFPATVYWVVASATSTNPPRRLGPVPRGAAGRYPKHPDSWHFRRSATPFVIPMHCPNPPLAVLPCSLP